MTIEKVERITSVELHDAGQVHIVRSIDIIEDGVVLASKIHRDTRVPYADDSGTILQDNADLPADWKGVVRRHWSAERARKWNARNKEDT